MNPKSVNDLDPKLKAAYDRIMGSSFTPGQATQTQTPPPPPPTQPTAQPESTIPSNPLPSTPPPTPASEQNTPIMQTQVYTPEVASPAPIEQTPEPAPNLSSSVFTSSPSTSPQIKKKGLNMVAVLLVIGGTIFFIGYVIVWAKVFGLF